MEPVFLELTIEGQRRQACLVDLPKHRTLDELADLLVAQHARRAEQTELVVLRPPVETAIVKPRKQDYPLDGLIRRTPRAEIRILHSTDFRHGLSHNLLEQKGEVYSGDALSRLMTALREREFEHYAVNCGGLLAARAGFVYRAPSGHYVRQFLRVGNIQKSRFALDAVFFWMLPYLEGCRAIIVDTWSISSIALNAARLLEKYRDGEDCRVEFLPAYFDGGRDVREKARTVLRYAWQDEGVILVLFSAVRSGRSFNRLRETIERAVPRKNVRYLAIYSLGSAVGFDALCTELPGFEDAKGQGSVITIDPSSFFPVTARDKPLLIRKPDAAANRDFFRRYKGARAIRIHRDVRDSSGTRMRHHAFDVEVEALLTKPTFRKRLGGVLDQIEQPAIVVAPPHNVGRSLGDIVQEFVQKKFRVAPQVLLHSDLNPDDGAVRSAFRKTKTRTNLLILDDVSTTGQRLNRFQMNLRTLEFRGHISYLVAVARPDDDQAWRQRVQNLRARENGRPNQVHWVEKIILPNWDETECPWCLEYEWLSEVLQDNTASATSFDLALARHRTLEAAADGEGLVDEVLWVGSASSRPVVTRGSIFLPHVGAVEADVVASVAGAIQRMRTAVDEADVLRNDYPQPRIVSPNNFLGPSPRYNDAILRMAVLRVTRPAELRRWDDADEAMRWKQFCDAFEECQGNMALELTVAISQRKVSLLEDRNSVLQRVGSQAVREILESVLQRL